MQHEAYSGLVITNINNLNAELNPVCHLLALFGAHHIFHVSGLRIKAFFVSVRELTFCTLKALCLCVSGDLTCVK